MKRELSIWIHFDCGLFERKAVFKDRPKSSLCFLSFLIDDTITLCNLRFGLFNDRIECICAIDFDDEDEDEDRELVDNNDDDEDEDDEEEEEEDEMV